MIKPLGVIFSYCWIATGIIFFTWSPLSIFVAFLLEFILLVVSYSVLLAKEELSGTRRRKNPSSFSVLIACSMLAFMHYLVILLILMELTGDGPFFKNPFIELARWGWLSIVAMLVFQLIFILENKASLERLRTFIFMDALIFTGTQVAGIVLVLMLGIKGVVLSVVLILAARLILELVLLKKML